MTQTQKIVAAVALVGLLVGGWWLTREAPEPPAPVAKTAPTPPKPEPTPPQVAPPPKVRVVETCEAARDYLKSEFEGELPDTPLARAQLSWDAGLSWAPGPIAEISPGGFQTTPRMKVPVGDLSLQVGKTERIQAAIALPGEAPHDVAALVWAGLNADDAERYQPQSESLKAWKAYRSARLDLRIYRWDRAKQAYRAHQLLDGPPTCDAPFDCGNDTLYPKPQLQAVGSQYLLVRALQREGCVMPGELCETVERMTVIGLDAERTMTRLAVIPIDVYTGLRPEPVLMRNRYLTYEPRFRDHNGDGALDLSLVGLKEKLTTVNESGMSVFSAVKRTMPYPIALRYLRTPKGFVPVELTMSDLFEPAFNKAVKRLTAKRLLVATAYRDLSDAANILQVIAEAVAHSSPEPPTELTDPTLYCVTVDNAGKGPVCRGEGLGAARAVDVDVIQSRAVDMVRMWARIRDDVPLDAVTRLDASLNRIFRWICKAGESELVETSPAAPPARPPIDPNAPPPPPTPVSTGAPGGELLPPAPPAPRQTPMPTGGTPHRGAASPNAAPAPAASPKTAPAPAASPKTAPAQPAGP